MNSGQTLRSPTQEGRRNWQYHEVPKAQLETEVVELVAAFGDDLVLVDPDIAVAG
jgi:hypothetical protein